MTDEGRETEEFTPTTEAIRAGYFDGEYEPYNPDYAGDLVYARFDRWLAARDAEMRAEGIRQAREAVGALPAFSDVNDAELALAAIDALAEEGNRG